MSEIAATEGARGYGKLIAFQEAHALVKATYASTIGFPKSEMYGLTSQMRRAAVSVAANIVEGYSLGTTALYLRHLHISFGSCKELEYYLELARELVYLNDADYSTLCDLESRTAYLIGALIRGLKQKSDPLVREDHAHYRTSRFDCDPSVPSHSSHSPSGDLP